MKKTILLILLILTSVYIYAQDLTIMQPNTAKFPQLETALTVRGNNNAKISTFDSTDFDVYESGVLVPSKLVSVSCVPINSPVQLLMVVDISTSMSEIVGNQQKIEWVKDGMRNFLNKINITEFSSIGITNFCAYSILMQDFTSDKSVLLSAIEKFRVVQATTDFNKAFLEPYTGAIPIMKTRPDVNRVIVFLSDGKHDADRRGTFLKNEILAELKANNIKLFALTFMDQENIDLRDVAKNSGGDYYMVNEADRLSPTYADVANALLKELNCTLKWWSKPYCETTPPLINVEVRYKPLYVGDKTSYYPPLWSVFNLNFNKNNYSFGNPQPNNYTDEVITIAPQPWEYQINNISVNSQEYFEIIDYGNGSQTFPIGGIKLVPGKSYSIKVRFTQKYEDVTRRAVLTFDGSPCPVSVLLFGGKGKLNITNPKQFDVFSACDSIEIKWEGVTADTKTDFYYKYSNENQWTLIANNKENFAFKWEPPYKEGKINIKGVAHLLTATNETSEDISDEFEVVIPQLEVVKPDIYFGDRVLGEYNNIAFDSVITNFKSLPIKIESYKLTGAHPNDFQVHTFSKYTLNQDEFSGVTITFNPTDFNLRRAVLEIKGSCGDEVKITLEGMGVCFSKTLDLVDFGNVFINDTSDTVVNAIFYNPMNKEVTYTLSYAGANKDQFLPSWYNGKEYVCPADTFKSHLIRFNPKSIGKKQATLLFDVKDCGTFKTNLIGNCILEGLRINNLDFGRTRYKSKFDTLNLVITNKDNFFKNIIGHKYLSGEQNFKMLNLPDQFELLADESKSFQVVFEPDKVDKFKAEIEFYTEAQDTLKTIFIGETFLPELDNETICPDNPILNKTTDFILKLYNQSISSSLYIYDMEIISDTNEFNWKQNFNTKDIIIPKNDSLVIKLDYLPQPNLSHQAILKIYADNHDGTWAEQYFTNEIVLNCDALSFNYTQPVFGNYIVCSSKDTEYKITNLSEDSQLKIFQAKATFSGDDADNFSLENSNEFTIEAGETKPLSVIFKSDRLGEFNAISSIPTSAGESIVLNLNAYTSENTQIASPLEKEFKPGDEFDWIYSINIPKLDQDEIYSLDIKIVYNSDVMFMNRKKITTLVSDNINSSKYLITDKLISTLDTLFYSAKGKLPTNQKIDLLKIPCLGLYTSLNETYIIGKINYTCHSRIDTLSHIYSKDLCYGAARLIQINEKEFEVSGLLPNPCIDLLSIDYTIPYSLNGEIAIYDYTGRKTLILKQGQFESGKFNESFNISGIESGQYILKVNFGAYSKVLKFIKIN